MLDYSISDLAEADLREACTYYDAQRRGLAREFLNEFEQAVRQVRTHLSVYLEVLPEVRRKVMRIFPYLIIFRVKTNRVEVLAVYHARRDPRKMLERG